MLAGPLTTAFFPFLSGRFAETDQRGARLSLGRALVTVVFVFAPFAAAAWLVAHPLVVVLFERGSFDIRSSGLTASALRLYAPAVLALALNELIGSSFHARQDTLTPMRAGFIRVAGNALLCAVLTPALGHRGIALATTLALLAKLAYLAASLRRVFAPAEARRHLAGMGRVLLAVGAMAAVVYPVASFASTPAVLQSRPGEALVALSVLCLSTYAAALWLFARRLLLVHVALVRRSLLRPLRRVAGSVGSSMVRVPDEVHP
jgi:putative peptidoglycan lipid II flippase